MIDPISALLVVTTAVAGRAAVTGRWRQRTRRRVSPHRVIARRAPAHRLTRSLRSAEAARSRLDPLGWRARRDRRTFPRLLDDVARALRSGASMPQALAEAAARDDSGPRRSLQGVVARIHAGESLRAALGWWVEESGGTEVRLTAAALSLGAEAGGSRARAVEQVASTLRERGAVEAEVRTLSSQVRASVSVLVLAPIAFAGLALSVDPTVGRFLVGSPVGLLCLAGGLLLDAAGAVWMARVTGRPV